MPAFLSRTFRHTSVYVRTDRVKKPADLKGRKVGVPEYQLTANVWARAFLEDDYGVKPADIHWIRGGIEEPGRPEKLALKLPAGVRLDNAPEGATISACSKPARSTASSRRGRRNWLRRAMQISAGCSADPVAVAKDYFKRTGFFPIMHVLGVRRELAERHPWLPGAVFKAFVQAKALAVQRLADTAAASVTLPFVEEMLKDARAAMGEDFWPYGVGPNRKVLDYFLGQHHAQGLSSRRVVGRGAVSSGDLRDVQGLTAITIPGAGGQAG